jgi:hypothetical protein
VNAALGPYAIAAALLVVAGVAKAARPHETAVAIRGVGIPSSDWLVRLGGAVEVAVGLVALSARGRVPAALVLASFALFLAFVVVAFVRGLPIASCGCFGKADTPPDLLHAGVNAGAALAALALVVDPGLAPFDLLRGEGFDGVAFALLVLVGVAAALLVLTLLPRALVLARGRADAHAA